MIALSILNGAYYVSGAVCLGAVLLVAVTSWRLRGSRQRNAVDLKEVKHLARATGLAARRRLDTHRSHINGRAKRL